MSFRTNVVKGFYLFTLLKGQSEVIFRVNVKLDIKNVNNLCFLSAQLPQYLMDKKC